MLKIIAIELRKHSPFTGIGAFTGIMVMLISYNIPGKLYYYVLYTSHFLLSGHLAVQAVLYFPLYLIN